VQELAFEGRDEALGQGVIEGVSHGSHREEKSCLFETLAELHGGVLRAAIGVMDEPRSGAAVVDRHVEGIEYQLGAEVVGHRPAHDLAGESVEHESKIEAPFSASSIGDVRNPKAIGTFGCEVAHHQVRRVRGTFEDVPAGGVRTRLRPLQPTRAAFRIKRATRFFPHLIPEARNSACTRGAP
jgi:hypothetical protein